MSVIQPTTADRLRDAAQRLCTIRGDFDEDNKDVAHISFLRGLADQIDAGDQLAAIPVPAADEPEPEDECDCDEEVGLYAVSITSMLGQMVQSTLALYYAATPEEAKGVAFDNFRSNPANNGYAVICMLAQAIED